MRAYVYDAFAPGGMRFVEAASPPTAAPAAGQLLVRVRAVAVNPVDFKLPSLVPFSAIALRGRPVAQDFAGVVEAAGAGCRLGPGDAVWGTTEAGCLAERVLAPDAMAAPKPEALSFAEAASLVTAALTALQALGGFGRADLRPGQRVVVAGASGGCGSAGAQLARALVGPAGVVVGICSAASAPAVAALGCCDELLDYNDVAAVKAALARRFPFDAVYDTVSGSGAGAADTLGGESYEAALRPFVKAGGLVVAINGTTAQWIGALTGWQKPGFRLFMQSPKDAAAQLATAGALVAGGKLLPLVDSAHAFDAAGCEAAYARLKSRRARGKVIVEME